MAQNIDKYGIIGNMRTAALISERGSIDMLCLPDFDSPSVFCRLLDDEKGGHFSIESKHATTSLKQQYLPFSNILATKHISEYGVFQIVDFFPRTKHKDSIFHSYLIRRVECIRREMSFRLECFPAFNYARSKHSTTIGNCRDNAGQQCVTFTCDDGMSLELAYTIDCGGHETECPLVLFNKEQRDHLLGEGVTANVQLSEGHTITFILKQGVESSPSTWPKCDSQFVEKLKVDTAEWWFSWVNHSSYRGRWREVMMRSLLTLKLLTYEPSGAIVAAPTFSIPEEIGGSRNWDYRYTWVRRKNHVS